MHQGYVKDADRLNAQLDGYAENLRYQELFIDLVRNALNCNAIISHLYYVGGGWWGG